MTTKYTGKTFNSTFRGAYPTEFNACVGDNGNPSYYEYATGFADSAVILIDEAIRARRMDEFVYPICFNMRHAVELRLKHFSGRLRLLRDGSNRSDFDPLVSHDIENIWNHLNSEAAMVDERLVSCLAFMDAVIRDIAEIDPTGQTFRYPLDTNSRKHLTDVSLINLSHLRERFISLRDMLEDLHKLMDYLSDEYDQRTFTKNLSREDIRSISEMLPERIAWREELGGVKGEIKRKYEIGSKEFSESLKIIENHYEFSKNIGISLELQHATINEWNILFDALISIHPLERYGQRASEVITFRNFDADIIVESITVKRKAIDSCKKRISIRSLIDIYLVYEQGRSSPYSEFYKNQYAHEMAQVDMLSQSEEELWNYINYLVSKVNAYECIIAGLQTLKQDHVLQELDRNYGLSGYFSIS